MDHLFLDPHHRPPAGALSLGRRGYHVGWVCRLRPPAGPDDPVQRWRSQHAIHLPGILDEALAAAGPALEATEAWVAAVLEETEWETLLEAHGLLARLDPDFQWCATVFDDTDPQAIARLDFRVAGLEGEDEVWMKASWLSLYEADPSLRFRFSHGLDRYEDVAADPLRQDASSRLCERFFPEARLLTTHGALQERIAPLVGGAFDYVERIVYFNAPDGGAQFHQDVERGHAGVVYAQLSGETFWFALPKTRLATLARALLLDAAHAADHRDLLGEAPFLRLRALAEHEAAFLAAMDDLGEDDLPRFLNESPRLAARLVADGYAFHLRPGDVLLLPQRDLADCCWHSVFGLGAGMGQALSFALRPRRG